jgi:hypothetical protein
VARPARGEKRACRSGDEHSEKHEVSARHHVGDLTHGIGVAGLPVPGLSFGTDMQGIFNLIGSSYKVVTVDGRRAECANPLGI